MRYDCSFVCGRGTRALEEGGRERERGKVNSEKFESKCSALSHDKITRLFALDNWNINWHLESRLLSPSEYSITKTGRLLKASRNTPYSRSSDSNGSSQLNLDYRLRSKTIEENGGTDECDPSSRLSQGSHFAVSHTIHDTRYTVHGKCNTYVLHARWRSVGTVPEPVAWARDHINR